MFKFSIVTLEVITGRGVVLPRIITFWPEVGTPDGFQFPAVCHDESTAPVHILFWACASNEIPKSRISAENRYVEIFVYILHVIIDPQYTKIKCDELRAS